MFIVRANAANTGTINTPNLQINSYASRRIKKIGGVALIANDIVSGMNMILVYNEAQDCYYLINHESTFLKRDGTAAMLAALNMDSHKITNLTAGTVSADAVNYTQLTTYTGNSAVEFAVATATTGNSAVNKTQFDAKTGLATTTTPGIVEKATQAEMNAGTADKFPSALEIFSGLSKSIGANGYLVLPVWMGNVAIQWGVNNSNTNPLTITFPVAFDTCYGVFAQSDNALSGGEVEYTGVSDITNSNFQWNGIRDGVTAFTHGWWFAIGVKA